MMSFFREKTRALYVVLASRLSWIILSLGIVFRLKHYLENRSVWLDEACLTVSITSRSLKEIFSYFEIFPEFPKQPLFFLVIERILVSILGTTDMVLRFFPFFSAILALILFYRYLCRYASRDILPWALALFAFAEPMVYYAGEVKQYSSDLLMAVLALWVFEWIRRCEYKTGALLWLLAFGAAGLWMSNALLFILAAFGVVLLDDMWARKRYAAAPLLFLIAAVWLLVLLVIYKLSLASMVGSTAILSTFAGSVYTGSWANFPALIWWALTAFLEMFRGAAGIYFTPLAGFLCLSGAALLWKRDRSRFWMFLFPVLATLVAAALEKYPFRGRLILFLMPGVILLIAEAICALISKYSAVRKVALTVALLAALVAPSFLEAGFYLFHSHAKIETREALRLFHENYRQGDLLVFNTAGQEPFWHYAPIYGYGRLLAQPLGLFEGELQRGVRVVKFALDSIKSNGRECVPMRYEYNVYDAGGHFRRLLSGGDQLLFACQDVPLISKENWGRVWLYVATHDPLEQALIDIVKRSFDLSAKKIVQKEDKGVGLYLYEFP